MANGVGVAKLALPVKASLDTPSLNSTVLPSGEGTFATLLRLDTASFGIAPLPQCRAFAILTDREKLTLRQTEKPEWAVGVGRDRFGLWADFCLESKQGQPVVQRLRWIPPGRFMMGSPDGEPGRYDDEGPQHPVTITNGYWLFDTPCTQTLWEAVMDENPSNFKSPRRPVEQVSWNDAKTFLQRINEKNQGLDLALPNEAQWEYACRAGTDTALYTGPIEIIGERNAPGLDDIAWYGGNSGVGFDLDNGYDTSGWTEMQYPNPKSGTREVGQKQPNPWGLYDMLGNVWEWVEDPWHSSYEGAPTDGSVWESAEAGAGRVLRGGSWGDYAGSCRSAFRVSFQPDVQVYGTGFRCARVQA
jgi:formylglycine-generating enzyme required for sulfatase activity